MQSINHMVLVSTFLFVAVGLIYSPNTMRTIFAEPPDPCFGDDCPGSRCTNYPDGGYAICCWTGPNGDQICQACDVSPGGDFDKCDPPMTKGIPDSSIIAPPPSGVAPPPSTEKCPDNSAVDSKGNCTPTTKLPDDTSDNNKPNLRGSILNDMMSSQSQDSSDSGEEQENQSNG